jgi:hypothetical protein
MYAVAPGTGLQRTAITPRPSAVAVTDAGAAAAGPGVALTGTTSLKRARGETAPFSDTASIAYACGTPTSTTRCTERSPLARVSPTRRAAPPGPRT